MAMKIGADCVDCGACLDECPNMAISDETGDFVIDPERCTECVDEFAEPQCVVNCIADCIAPDPDYAESVDMLRHKRKRRLAS